MTLIPPATDLARLDLPRPYLLFLGDVTEAGYAKTAFGLRDWAREHCVGELSFANAISVGLPRLTPEEARACGAQSMVIGVANVGGKIIDSWVPALIEALAAGLDLVSGMHARLANTPALAAAAERHHRRLIDVRTPPRDIPIASGRKRSGKRLLAVGTDCRPPSRARRRCRGAAAPLRAPACRTPVAGSRVSRGRRAGARRQRSRARGTDPPSVGLDSRR